MAKRGGKRAGAGRKTRVVEQNLNELLKECATDEEMKEVVRLLVLDSKHTAFSIRQEARKLLLAYKYGRPVDRLELSGEGGGPIPITIIEPVKPESIG